LPCLSPYFPSSFPTRRSSDLFCRRFIQFPFELSDPAILNFARLRQFTTTLGALKLGAELIKFFFPFPLLFEDCFLFLPFGFERIDRKSTRLNSSHQIISYAVF